MPTYDVYLFFDLLLVRDLPRQCPSKRVRTEKAFLLLLLAQLLDCIKTIGPIKITNS
jgi:hypothetical protein